MTPRRCPICKLRQVRPSGECRDCGPVLPPVQAPPRPPGKRGRRVLTVALLLALASFSAPARAADGPLKPLLGGIVAANLADALSTYASIHSGHGHEANPIMAKPVVAVSLKAGATAFEVLAIRHIWHAGHQKTAIGVALFIAGSTFYVSARNVQIARGR